MNDRFYTVHEAAEILKLHPRTVVRKIKDGSLNGIRIGRQYRINGKELESFTRIRPRETGKREKIKEERSALVSSVVDLDGISAEEGTRMKAETSRLKVIINSRLAAAPGILRIIEVFLEQNDG